MSCNLVCEAIGQYRRANNAFRFSEKDRYWLRFDSPEIVEERLLRVKIILDGEEKDLTIEFVYHGGLHGLGLAFGSKSLLRLRERGHNYRLDSPYRLHLLWPQLDAVLDFGRVTR